MLDLIIIGAGPYGISIAAHAAAHGLSYRLLGYPMDFWKNQMPRNMFIRTPHDLVRFSDPEGRLTIQRFAKETNSRLESPLPRSLFIRYAAWFAEKAGVTFTPELVVHLKRAENGYSILTEKGLRLNAKHVVVSTGIKDFPYIPPALQPWSPAWVTHTLGYTSFESFRGKDVVVVGSGQSAWEAAALLHEAGSNAQVVYRSKSPVYGGNRAQEVVLKGFGHIFFKLPSSLKRRLLHIASATVPIARFLRPLVDGKVPQIGHASIEGAKIAGDKIQLALSNGTEVSADHVIAATGFKLNLDRLPFMDKELLSGIAREENCSAYPKLNRHFESNLKGLYFAGPLASYSHGPTFRFILGLDKASRTIIGAIRRQEG